jgi:Putative peptidoglycan-binding domain-containing protein
MATRVFFQRAPSGFRTVQGELIKKMQKVLIAKDLLHDTDDGIFGGNTERAVQIFQEQNQLAPTGKVDDQTWQALMSSPAPDLKQRCLQLTADFEGTGFTKAVGNFDGAGITWGIIGFTLSNGELGAVLTEIRSTHPAVFSAAFGELEARIVEVIHSSHSEQIHFANSISLGSSKMRILDVWAKAFEKLGSDPSAQEIQLQRTEKFFQIAERDRQLFDVQNELGLALCFDIAVQNGGIDSTERARIRAKINQNHPATQQDLRIIIANVVAENSRPRFIEDVRRRKLTIATAQGTVHGSRFAVKTWGLDDLPAS